MSDLHPLVIDSSVSAHIGASMLSERFVQTIEDFENTKNGIAAFGVMRVLAAQAIKELEAAERTSKDPIHGLDTAA